MAKSTDGLYRHYTAAEIEAANETDLPDLLSSLGYHVKPVGRYFTTMEMDSLRIKNRRVWFRYSAGKGGNAITFLRHFHGFSFPEAVGYLLAFNCCFQPIQRSRLPPERERPVFVLPPPHSDNKRVCAYLRARGINQSVIERFIKGGLLYEEAEHHSCVFVGRDRAGKPVFAAKRGTLGNYKGDVAGSDKETGFCLPCDSAIDRVYVFESPVDMMSWFTLYGPANAVALCGLYEGPLNTYLRENPGIERISLCLDSDGRGRTASAKIDARFQARGYDAQEIFPPSGKDWNEYLSKFKRT